MSSDATAYFDRLRTHLHLGEDSDDDAIRELAAHVADETESLIQRGDAPERARRAAIDRLGRPRTLAHLLHQAQLTTPWRDVAFGSSAFALLALVIGLQGWRMPLVALTAAVIVVGITLYGLWLGRPSWFYPWAGVALTLPLAAGYLAFAVLHRELGNVGSGEATPLTLVGVSGAVLYFPVGLVVVAAAVVVAVRRDWLDASVLLSPLPGVLVLIVAVHRAGGLASAADPLPSASLMLSGLYLCMALATLLFLRAPVRQTRVVLLLGGAMALLAVATLVADPNGGMVTLSGRAALLLAFLLSPALVARHAMKGLGRRTTT